MLRRLLVLVLSGALGAWMLAACDDGDGDGDVDADADTDTDADGDVEGWPCAQPSTDSPQFRLTTLQVTAPAALRNALLSAIIEGSIDDFGFIWLLELNGTTITTGSGRPTLAQPNPSDPEFCQVTWNADYASQDQTVTVTGDTFSTTDPIALLEIPIYSEDDPVNPLLVLPITLLELVDVEMNADRTLIGTPNTAAGSSAFAGDWVPAGSIRGWISVEDAMNVPIEDLGQTLCGLLSGDDGEAGPEDDCSSEQSTWENQPETIPGTTDPGYLLEANIGAGAVTIGS